jgi:hypothetical protein
MIAGEYKPTSHFIDIIIWFSVLFLFVSFLFKHPMPATRLMCVLHVQDRVSAERVLHSVFEQCTPPDLVLVHGTCPTDIKRAYPAVVEVVADKAQTPVDTVTQTIQWLCAYGHDMAPDADIVFLDPVAVLHPKHLRQLVHGVHEHPDACVGTRGLVVGTMVGYNFMHVPYRTSDACTPVDVVHTSGSFAMRRSVLGCDWKQYQDYSWLPSDEMEGRARRLPSLWLSAKLEQQGIPRYLCRGDDRNRRVWIGLEQNPYELVFDYLPLMHYLHIRLSLFQTPCNHVSRVAGVLLSLYVLQKLVELFLIYLVYRLFVSATTDSDKK